MGPCRNYISKNLKNCMHYIFFDLPVHSGLRYQYNEEMHCQNNKHKYLHLIDTYKLMHDFVEKLHISYILYKSIVGCSL